MACPRWFSVLSSVLLCLAGLAQAGAATGGQQGFAAHVLQAVSRMPAGGGYAADRAAERRLAVQGIVWQAGQLRVQPKAASPTFCSAACYMVLLQALQSWQRAGAAPFTPAQWYSLRVDPVHADGYLSWGRVNANGPGLAKWVQDLGAGVNFSDVQHARPGDFLKYFHTADIGVHERGHMVVFLGTEQQEGQLWIRYWSANRPQGYGVRSVPWSRMHHPIFTRITHPEKLAGAARLPAHDSWLADMLTKPCSLAEVARRCALRSRP